LSSVTPAASKLFLAPETSESMIAVFHLACTMAIRNPEPTTAMSRGPQKACGTGSDLLPSRLWAAPGPLIVVILYGKMERRIDGRDRRVNVYEAHGSRKHRSRNWCGGEGGMPFGRIRQNWNSAAVLYKIYLRTNVPRSYDEIETTLLFERLNEWKKR
jgi:hypothetical protein